MEGQPNSQLTSKLELDSRIFAGLSYLSVLFVVPWITKRDDKFVMFHVRQGAALFLAEVVVWFVLWLLESFLTTVFSSGALTLISVLYKLAWLFFAAVSLAGVYFAVKGMEKQLPVLGLLSRNLKL